MPIVLVLLLLLVVVPLVEIYVLILVGREIGALTTVGLCVATAALGTVLLRVQGLSAVARARAMLDRDEIPAMELLEGVVLVIAAVLLLTPGFMTDAIGFLCLIPPLRQAAIRHLMSRAVVIATVRGRQGRRDGKRVIEGEYRRDDDP